MSLSATVTRLWSSRCPSLSQKPKTGSWSRTVVILSGSKIAVRVNVKSDPIGKRDQASRAWPNGS